MFHRSEPPHIVKASIVTLALSAFLLGCKEKKSEGTPLAEVDEAKLTLEEVRRAYPPEYEQVLPREQYLEYVRRWIDDEVLHREAIRAGLDQDSTLERKVSEMRRRLLIEAFLNQESAATAVEPDDIALSQHYEMHKDEFKRRQTEWKFVALKINSLKEAQALKPKLRNQDWLSQAQPYLAEPIQNIDGEMAWTQLDQAASCLRPALEEATASTVAGPLNCPEGVMLLKVIDRAEAGSLLPIELVRDQIAGQLLMQRRDRLRENVVTKYKQGLPIRFHLEKIPGIETPLIAVEEDTLPDTETGSELAESIEAVSQRPKTETAARPKPRTPKPARESEAASEQSTSSSSSTNSPSAGATVPAPTSMSPSTPSASPAPNEAAP